MQETTQSKGSFTSESLRLVNTLLDAVDFRTKIAGVLKEYAQQAGADSVFFLELLPNLKKKIEYQYQRILQVERTGEEIEHEIPPVLTERKLEYTKLYQRLIALGKDDKEVNQRPPAVPTMIMAESPDDEVYKSTFHEKVYSFLVKKFGLKIGAFVLLPLFHDGQIWGFLFLITKKPHKWPNPQLALGRTLSKLLGRLLCAEFHLREDFVVKELRSKQDSRYYTAGKFIPINLEYKSALSEQEFIRVLVTTVPDCLFVVDLEYNQVVYASQETIAGHHLMEEERPLQFFGTLIHPDERQKATDNFFRRFREASDDDIIESEYRILHKDGHWVWIQERVRVFQRFPDGKVKQYLSALIDVTEKKLNAIKLVESERRYRNFVQYSTEGIYFMNCGRPISTQLPLEKQEKLYYANAYIEECNEAMAKMYGVSSTDEMVGRSIKELHAGEYYELNSNSFRAFAGNSYRIEAVETLEQDRSGNWRYFENHAIGLVENNYLIGIWGMQRDVTETRLAEKALRETELKLTSFVEGARIGIWEWDWKNNWVVVNEILLAILHLEEQEALLTQEEFMELIAPADRQVWEQAMQQHFEKNTENYQVDIQMGPDPTNRRWVRLHGRLVERQADGSPKLLVGSLISIHENKISELLLAEGEALLQAVVQAIPDAKFRVGRDGTILAFYATAAEQAKVALSNEQIVGKHLRELFPFAVTVGLEFNAKKALEEGTLQTFEFAGDVSDEGERNFYEARINAINPEEYILIVRDISAIKQAEQALTEQVHEVDRKNRELEAYIKSNLQLENFAYIASHDLREPARTMRTFSQFLKKRAADQLDDDSKMYLDFIISGANRMNQLIQDLLTYSRVNTEPFERETINVEELLSEVQENLKGSIEETGAQISLKNLPKEIQGSAVRLQQLFQNLLSNAIKFHQPEQAPEIKIAAKETATHWSFTVADNGIGIDPEFHDQVFVIFKKLHNNQTYQGTGIGLALVKRIVAQHDGDIWLESALDQGTQIHFTLRK